LGPLVAQEATHAKELEPGCTNAQSSRTSPLSAAERRNNSFTLEQPA
jgi:hypothetical protein